MSIWRRFLQARIYRSGQPRLLVGQFQCSPVQGVYSNETFRSARLASAFFGCALTPNVDNRKPGQPWNYYGDLANVYRDQTGGTKVALVWLDQVHIYEGDPKRISQDRAEFSEAGVSKDRFHFGSDLNILSTPMI